MNRQLTTVEVELRPAADCDRSYTIVIGTGLLQTTADQMMSLAPSQCVIVADDNVSRLYAARLLTQLQDLGVASCLISFPAGEASKSMEQFSQLCSRIIGEGIDRQAVVIALGGGVTGDLAGYVAASLLRGIRFVQVPTTLLAQVDSSVGGKTGINLEQAKNIVGAFWQPSRVIIDPEVLTTLETRQVAAGLAEVVKYGMILDADFFEWLERSSQPILNLDMGTLTHLIARCCELKAQVVKADETETVGRRVILNYGHTFGHAIERVFGYGRYLHGEAIAIGMNWAAGFAVQLGRLDPSIERRQQELLQEFRLPLHLEPARLERHRPFELAESLVNAMEIDKKSKARRINLILPTNLGRVELVPNIPRGELMNFINARLATLE